MRELTPEECEFIAGGLDKKPPTEYSTNTTPAYPGDEIDGLVVVSSPPPYPTPPYNPPTTPPEGLPPTPPGPSTGGGGTTPQTPPGWSECLDHKADSAARDALDLIKDKADRDKNEYGAYLWKDAQGAVHVGTLIKGNNSNIPDMIGKTPQEYGFTSWSQVVGQVHSHPNMFYSQYEGKWIAVPDDNHFENPSPGDWANVDQVVALTGNAAVFRSYIVYKDTVYEYDHYQNNNQGLTGQQRTDAAVRGNYDPNATCPPQ